VGAIESDLGAEHPLGFNAKVSAAALPFMEPVQEILQSIGANLMRPTTFSPGADLTEMAKAEVPSFGVMQEGLTYFNYHHSAADTLDKVDPRELKENAAAMAVLAYALTNMPETLPR
jgi:carboxypeptidase Q